MCHFLYRHRREQQRGRAEITSIPLRSLLAHLVQPDRNPNEFNRPALREFGRESGELEELEEGRAEQLNERERMPNARGADIDGGGDRAMQIVEGNQAYAHSHAHTLDDGQILLLDSYDDSRPELAGTRSSFKQYCRRFRFLRAFEFLLLFSYETLTEQALQLVNCVGVGSCGSVLAEYPDVRCPNDSRYIPLLIIAILVLIYAAAFPVWLFVFLRRLCGKDGSVKKLKKANGNSEPVASRSPTALSQDEQILVRAKFGIFYDQFKPRFWWWEIQVNVGVVLCVDCCVLRIVCIACCVLCVVCCVLCVVCCVVLCFCVCACVCVVFVCVCVCVVFVLVCVCVRYNNCLLSLDLISCSFLFIFFSFLSSLQGSPSASGYFGCVRCQVPKRCAAHVRRSRTQLANRSFSCPFPTLWPCI